VDIAYFYWTYSLKFTYPKYLLDPIYDAFLGKIEDIKIRLKLVNQESSMENQAKEPASNINNVNENNQANHQQLENYTPQHFNV
jgi:hypothetical protein